MCNLRELKIIFLKPHGLKSMKKIKVPALEKNLYIYKIIFRCDCPLFFFFFNCGYTVKMCSLITLKFDSIKPYMIQLKSVSTWKNISLVRVPSFFYADKLLNCGCLRKLIFNFRKLHSLRGCPHKKKKRCIHIHIYE